jgi:phage terminase large subunit-like protein
LTLKKDIENYCKNVLNGKQPSCQYVINSIKRFNEDVKRDDLELNYEKATFAILFVESLNHVDGSPFVLESWQKFIITNLFGFYYKNGKRRFKSSYIEVPRKNGKTALAAAIALYGLVADTRDDAQVYTCATTRDQATLCYKAASKMVRNSWLNQVIRTKQYELINIEQGYEAGIMRALSSDSNTLDGLKPYFAVVDEYHAHKTDEVYNVVKSGMGATVDPLLFTITTAGFNRNSPCFIERKYCIDILTNKLKDDTTFAMIYTIDDEDWQDESGWAKANPNLNVSVDIDFLKSELIASRQSGTKEINFKTKYLNIWTDTATTWISDEKWMNTGSNIDLNSLKGRDCYGGLDLSKSQDFSSLCLIFPPINDEIQFICLYYFWLPEETAKDRRKRNYSNLLEWQKQGLINLTEGNVIDHQLIRNEINQLAGDFTIKYINFDRAFNVTLVTELGQDGITMHPFGQGYLSMGAPTSEFERMVLNEELNHGNNDIMRWMMSNVHITRDAAGNMKADKQKAGDAIDGVVANIMAVAAYQQSVQEQVPEKEYFFIKIR